MKVTLDKEDEFYGVKKEVILADEDTTKNFDIIRNLKSNDMKNFLSWIRFIV